MANRASVFLWFDSDALEAAQFYADTFPDSVVGNITRSSVDVPGAPAGSVQVVEMTLCGLPYVLLNGGPQEPPNDRYSLQVYTDDQAETDRLWNALTGYGGAEIACGWCKDRWGYRWQITPRALMTAIADPDREAARRAMEAMMTMTKIDIAAIEAARHGLAG